MKMKKLGIFLISTMLIGVLGCGKSSYTSNESKIDDTLVEDEGTNDTIEDDNVAAVTDTTEDIDIEDVNIDTADEEESITVLDEYDIGLLVGQNLYGGEYKYCDGIAIAKINKGTFDTEKTAVIDEDGNALLILEHGQSYIIEGNIYTEYVDNNNDGYSYCDRYGNIIFERRNGDTVQNVNCYGYTNGIFLFSEKRVSFSSSELWLVAIDVTGNIVKECQIDEYIAFNMKSHDDGLFVGSCAYYDTFDNTLRIYCHVNGDASRINDIMPLCDGKALVKIYVPAITRTYQLTLEDIRGLCEEYDYNNRDEKGNYIFQKTTVLKDFTDTHENKFGTNISYCGGGIYAYSDGGNCCYDIINEVNIPEPDYGEQTILRRVSYGYGDYMYATIEGADGRMYMTILDRAGNALFDPVCVEGYSSNRIGMFGDVVYMTDYDYKEIVALNSRGELYAIDDFTNIAPEFNPNGYWNASGYFYKDGVGFITYEDDSRSYYVETWEGTFLFDKVKITEKTLYMYE